MLYGDGEKATVNLLHSHGADLDAQDGAVSLCTCASLREKCRKHTATKLELRQCPVCILDAVAMSCHVRIVISRLGTPFF